MQELVSIVEGIIYAYAATYEWLGRRFGWPIAIVGTLVLPTLAIVALVVGLFWAL